MSGDLGRRDFLKAMPATALVLSPLSPSLGGAQARSGEVPPKPSAKAERVRIAPMDYRGVRLRPSRWHAQSDAAREVYFGFSNDDILHGFRAAAGLSAPPGRPLGGWCGRDSHTVFGQWLSGLSRMYRATGDARMRDKAVLLFTEWAKTVKADGDCRMRHYAFDKLVCGLVDLQLYADHEPAIAVLERVTDFASRTFDRSNNLADPTHNTAYYGVPQEWYTLAENLYRAYQLTDNPKFRTFAEAWLYPAYWNKFASTSSPADAHGVHAYSHVNTFSSAAMAYEITGDPSYLRIVRNAYDYLQQTQCYATGGYGPNERFMAPGGSLGRALDTRSDTAEIVCGSWAGFKLARYLMRFTGEAKYGDWIERLLYNGVGAALPLQGNGRNFYYADYRVGGGMKVFNWDTFTCCSGTYIQNTADYHNLIYFTDPAGLYVNLYLPSEVTWSLGSGTSAKAALDTAYPEAETVTLALTLQQPAAFAIRFRVPQWTQGMSIRINGQPAAAECRPGTWASIERRWTSGDRIEVTIPLTLRMEAVDRQHPDRVAVMRGPVVLVLEGAYHAPYFRLPERDDDLARWLVPERWTPPLAVLTESREPPFATASAGKSHDAMTVFRVVPPDKSAVRLRFRPFYDVPEHYPYFMYFDRKALPWTLW